MKTDAKKIASGSNGWYNAQQPKGKTEIPGKGHTGVTFQEFDGDRVREDHSSAVGSMDNGDKYYVRAQRTITAKEERTGIDQGTWNFTGGTGKLKGLKGKGTFKCTSEGDNATCDIEGEYTLPSK